MSRSGYSDDCENLEMWRGAVRQATYGRRGQAFFRDLVTALDAMPIKRLIEGDLETDDGEVCALGCLAKQKGATLEPYDTYDYDKLGKTFNIAHALAQEVMYENDEGGPWRPHHQEETPEERWSRIRTWAAKQILAAIPPDANPSSTQQNQALGDSGKGER